MDNRQRTLLKIAYIMGTTLWLWAWVYVGWLKLVVLWKLARGL